MTMMRALAVLALFAPIAAHASCTGSAGTAASFGSVTSFVVKNTAQNTSTTNVGLSCGGSLITIGTTNTIDGTITSTNAGYLVGPTGDKIAYKLYADSGHTTAINFGTTYNWASTSLVTLLGLFSGSTVSIPLFMQTTTGSTVAAGLYTDTLTVSWVWNYCTVGVVTCITTSSGSYTTTVPVQLTVTNDCQITAPNVAFGSAPTVSSFATISQSLSVLCTKGVAYTIGLTTGANPASSGRRQMASGTNLLQYDIYSATGVVWGNTTTTGVRTAVADGLTTQSFGYTASIYTDQATPPVGSYSDSVTVNVTY
jgi:spore coat protein U-like protein